MPPADSSGNRMLSRVAALLDAVDGSAASAVELARRSGLSVSTAHRLALSMTEYGFLARNERGEFHLGYRFTRSTLESAALPVLTELRDSTGETAQLWLRRGYFRVCTLSVDSLAELKATLPEGARLPLPDGSSGRLLAREPEALEDVALHGWTQSIASRTPGLGSVSAPVQQHGRMVAAVCLAVPLSRVAKTPGDDFGAAVAAAAKRISDDLETA
ncbi:IclR family transcriptional regulator [Arthrobacter sp. GCM10027362]|uniref:IclR family transcriptional regulator n=1 Tax=Arthrobacter sp. GCM10027362 TaxID=3273379 RepID=UPI0036368E5E